MTAARLDAADHIGQPPQVEIKETSIGDATISVAPISINIYQFPVQ